jgi:hypothetical protein
MKTLSTISAAALLATTFAIPAWAGPVGMGRTAPEAQANTQVNPELISQLQEASGAAVREGRTGNKNNPVFGQKSAQINDLIERLKSGQKVDPSEIDQAFEPARVW